MKFPVFSRRSNPAVDRPIVRKSRSYVEDQIARKRAVWVDPSDARKGIVCCEMLFFGNRPLPTPPSRPDYFPAELPGLRFQQPATSALPSMAAIRANWDWSREQVPLYA